MKLFFKILWVFLKLKWKEILPILKGAGITLLVLLISTGIGHKCNCSFVNDEGLIISLILWCVIGCIVLFIIFCVCFVIYALSSLLYQWVKENWREAKKTVMGNLKQ